MPICIPKREIWTRQPTGRGTLSAQFKVDFAYAPWLGKSVILGDGGTSFAQASISDPLPSRRGIGTTYAASVEPTAGPEISAYPFSVAAVIDVLATSGNVYAPSAVGLSKTSTSSPACVGLVTDFVGDARAQYFVGNVSLSTSFNVHNSTVTIIGVSVSATEHYLYVNGVKIGSSTSSATMFQLGGARLAIHDVREYNYGAHISTNSNIRVLLGAWFRRALAEPEAMLLSSNLWRVFAP